MRENFGFLDVIKKKRFAPGKGVEGPPPDHGIKLFGFLLWNHFWKLVKLNLLFLAFSIPVVTIPAAFCGVNRVLIKLIREGNCFLWTEFIKEFKANLFKSIPFGILGAFLVFDSYYCFSLSISMTNDGVEVFTAALGFLFIGFAILFLSYVFVFLPTLDLKNKYIAKNAFIFMATEWKTNFLILGSVLFAVIFSVVLFPYTLFFLVVITFSLLQFMICSAVSAPLEKRIIGPYEQSNEGNA